MYHVEKIINGVLCFKSTPNGEWIPFSVQEITRRLKQTKTSLKNMIEIVEEIPNFDGIITRPNSINDYQRAKELI